MRNWVQAALIAVALAGRVLGQARPFFVEVLDDQTGRGVPLVRLETVDHQEFYTDSGGIAVITPPDLQNQKVFFSVSSYGYEFPKDGFGYAGKAVDVKPGSSATLRIHHLNIAERLYRVTGSGIYADTILAGRPAPIEHPLLNSHIVGQDSVQSAILGGKLFWFYGDTSRASYPLGNFGTTGATSPLDTDPSVGVNLTYFTDEHDFARPMVTLPQKGPKWIDGLIVLGQGPDELLLARCMTVKDVGKPVAQHLLQFNAKTARFEPIRELPLSERRVPMGHPVRHTVGKTDYFYFPAPYPTLRVRAELLAITDPTQYEAFTPLKAGARWDAANPDLEKNAQGRVVWSWKAATDPISESEQETLVKSGRISPEDRHLGCRDAQSGRSVRLHGGSVNWNAFRSKWIMIAVAVGEKESFLGEVYYAEADRLEGPWSAARKIATHPHYSFYNPKQHPFFDREGGRVVYFEGTYVTTFSGNTDPTPRYDYNQIMYRLDLADPRLTASGK